MLCDSRRLAVAWPLDKLRRFRAILDDWVTSPRPRTAQEAAALLGLARHGAILSNTGIFWSISLQHQLNTIVKRSGAAATKKQRWWRFQRLPIVASVIHDLDMMRRFVPDVTDAVPDPFDYWWRPISLLIPREPNVIALSDASYGGMGGWSASCSFMWRLTRADLVLAGFDMRMIDTAGEDLRQYQTGFPDDDRGLHINIIELLAIVINLWLVLHHIRSYTCPLGGWIVNILADNTSALSWLHHAARNHRSPVVTNLTMLCQALMSFSHTDQIARFQGSHIPGMDNGPADALSRPTDYPTVDSVTKAYSQLQTCRFSHLPFALLSIIAKVASSTLTAAELVHEMMTLLTLGPRFSPAGYTNIPSEQHYWRRSKKRRLRR
jgi:hypothetical protein